MRLPSKGVSTLQQDQAFVVADPHVVYYDAVMHSPWNHEGGGHLPERDDWMTYRYAVKDIILGVATHRFNKHTHRQEIRAYFVGEHPMFKELEPTKAMLIVLCCQCYQSGGTMELFFEHGIPFDVRELIDRLLGEVISGHERLLKETLAKELFVALSGCTSDMQQRIESQGVPLEAVCYHLYRGTWAINHIKSLLQRSIPLLWIFERKPDPLKNPLIYTHLMRHLQATLLEEYAVHQLEDRQLGESFFRRITRIDEKDRVYYESEEPLRMAKEKGWIGSNEESQFDIPEQTRFCLLPIIAHSVRSLRNRLQEDVARAEEVISVGVPVFVVPLDFVYLPDDIRVEYKRLVRQAGVQLLVVGLTIAQLSSEIEISLAITATQVDPGEVETINVDRYPD